MLNQFDRRRFLETSAAFASLALSARLSSGFGPIQHPKKEDSDKEWFKISLAEWSLHRSINAGKLNNLDFPRVAREEFGIDAVEYVNSFFKTEVNDPAYMEQLKQRCADVGVKSLLIMVDGEGDLGAADNAVRKKAVQNHQRWLEAARFLGCHSIRVNAASSGSYEEQAKLAADGLSQLAEAATEFQLNVIVENHGGLSSNGAWLANVIATVDMDNCGTLPDFGNFQIRQNEWYDRYQGVQELMPFAKAVSAKSYDFDEAGNDSKTDYMKMLKIVKDAGYRGHVGIEYEGSRKNEFDGIRATKDLLIRCRKELA